MAELKLTKLQENKFSTFEDIETVFDGNSEIVAGIPELADSVAKFKNVISDISAKAVKKNTILKGTTQTKTNKRITLEAAVIENAAALSAFGAKTENEIIKAIASVSQSSLDKMRDTEIVNKAKTILNALTDNSAAMESFAISPDDINNLRTCIADYKTSSTDKSGSKTESVVISKTLRELFQNGMDILEKEIDKMMESIRSKQKNFYSSYHAVRKIKNLGVRHKKLPESKSVNG